MKLFDQIYIILLLTLQVLQQKNIWSNVLFWSTFIAEGGKYAKNLHVEKTMRCVFFLNGNTKIASLKKSKNITLSKKAQRDVFGFWKSCHFCIAFEKKLKA